MRIFYATKFKREYKRLPLRVKQIAEEKELLFRKDPFDKRLGTHKLHGRLKGYWAIWIDQKYRLIFEFAKKNVVWFHSVGDHSMYR